MIAEDSGVADLLVLVPAPVLGPASWQPAADGPTPVVGDDFLPHLRQLARDGVVPAWPQWFPEAEAASQRGWPVEGLPGSHLHMLVDPAAVAAALVSW
ncbi:MAG: hypothetical protein ACRDPO_28735 [Streptosporangiaceae bacterium]